MLRNNRIVVLALAPLLGACTPWVVGSWTVVGTDEGLAAVLEASGQDADGTLEVGEDLSAALWLRFPYPDEGGYATYDQRWDDGQMAEVDKTTYRFTSAGEDGIQTDCLLVSGEMRCAWDVDGDECEFVFDRQ